MWFLELGHQMVSLGKIWAICQKGRWPVFLDPNSQPFLNCVTQFVTRCIDCEVCRALWWHCMLCVTIYLSVKSFPEKKKGFRPVILRFRPVGLRFRPVGLRFRPVGLRFRPVGLRFRPVGLRFRPVGLGFRPVGLRFRSGEVNIQC